jgi:hypothetical protein
MERLKKIYTNKKYLIAIGLVLLVAGFALTDSSCKSQLVRKVMPPKEQPAYKPVIYFYPEKEQVITAQLFYQGNVFASYPRYDTALKGWKIKAFPNGKIIDLADQREYSYVFWEGMPRQPIAWDLRKGFVVKGSETREFLQNILPKIGLLPHEYNEFVVYWYPLLQNNPYNLIHFASEQYTNTAPLHISPEPNAMLRVFMVYKPLQSPVNIEKQEFTPFVRKGFTVVEWGGSMASDKNM